MSKSRLCLLSGCLAVLCDAGKAEIRAIAHRKIRDRGGPALKSQLAVPCHTESDGHTLVRTALPSSFAYAGTSSIALCRVYLC